jgi:hypothetical protein
MDWKNDNTITREMGAECYNTASLVHLFFDLESEGYSGLSLGLIIDLIRRDGMRAE